MRPKPLLLPLTTVTLVLLLAACLTSPVANDPTASASPQLDHSTLPLPKRLAFMTGHVQAGLALYRAGEPAMAAPHLLHPVSETHAAEREGLERLGFDSAVFTAVSAALEQGRPAAEVEPLLVQAENNLEMLAGKAGGDVATVIDYLLDTVEEEYAIGVPADRVLDIGEYQDAYGFTKVALARAQTLPGPTGQAVRAELATLLALWPKAPVPPAKPTRLATITSQVAVVRSALQRRP